MCVDKRLRRHASQRESTDHDLYTRIFLRDLFADERCVIDEGLQPPIRHRRAIDCATLTGSGSQPMHSLRVTDDRKVPARKKADERIVVITIITGFVVLKTAAKRWQQKNHATNRLVGQWLHYFCHEKAVQRIVAFLNGGDGFTQISADCGVLSVDDQIGLSLSSYVDK